MLSYVEMYERNKIMMMNDEIILCKRISVETSTKAEIIVK